MQFIHAIDLRNWFPCYNLALNGRLCSPNALALIDEGVREQHQSIAETPIEDLAQGLHPPTAATPRAISDVIRAGILRSGQQIVNGYDQEEIMSEETRHDALRCSDVELLFEEVRREVAPNSPSRLSCLYLADCTEEGEIMLRNMLGCNVYVLQVRPVQTLGLVKVDSAWFDGYFESQDIEYARNYWRGLEKPEGGKWEYLFDGIIEVEDSEQIEYIRKNGAHLALMAKAVTRNTK